MKFWQLVTWAETDQLIEIARFAEAVGFDGIVNSDHAVFPASVKSGYPYSSDGRPPMGPETEFPDCWVTIAAMAAATRRLRFSSTVFILPLRNPFEVAKATGTLAIVSGDRFILGAGVGWMREEFDLFGVDFATRGKRMTEMIGLMRKLWAGGPVSHSGEFFRCEPLQISPAPKRPVPVYLGGSSGIALRRAAALADGWFGPGGTPEAVAREVATLKRMRAEAGRIETPFETVSVLSTPPNLDHFRRLEAEGLDCGVNQPFSYFLGARSSLDEKKRNMERFAKAFIRPFETP